MSTSKRVCDGPTGNAWLVGKLVPSSAKYRATCLVLYAAGKAAKESTCTCNNIRYAIGSHSFRYFYCVEQDLLSSIVYKRQ